MLIRMFYYNKSIFFDLITEFKLLTGCPIVINTSFNVHEEPIVCKPEEGLKSLLKSVIDVFVCEDYICRLKKVEN